MFWTDSRVVLGYIANESRRFHIFVANRVQQIQEATDFHQWNYIESKQNPADLASRGIRASTLLKYPVWIKGPEFLWQDESQWETATSTSNQDTVELSEDDPEVRRVVTLATELDKPTETLLDRVERFSDWQRMRRAIALCLRYLKLLQQQRDKGVNKDSINLRKRPIGQCVPVTASSNKFIPKQRITVEQIQEAETRIIKTLQNDLFEDEIKKLKYIETLANQQDRCCIFISG